MYDFGKDITPEEKAFFGKYTGEPFLNPKGTGMIGTPGNVLTFPCKSINKTVPYFQQFKPEINASTTNKYIYNTIEILSNVHIEFG